MAASNAWQAQNVGISLLDLQLKRLKMVLHHSNRFMYYVHQSHMTHLNTPEQHSVVYHPDR